MDNSRFPEALRTINFKEIDFGENQETNIDDGFFPIGQLSSSGNLIHETVAHKNVIFSMKKIALKYLTLGAVLDSLYSFDYITLFSYTNLTKSNFSSSFVKLF